MSEEKKQLEGLVRRSELDDAIDDVAKMSDEEVAKENASAGIDMAKEVARNREVLAAAIAKRKKSEGGAVAAVVPLASAKAKRTGVAKWAVVALAAAVLLAIAWQLSKREVTPKRDVALPDPSTVPTTTDSSKPAVGCRPLGWRDGGLSPNEASFDGTVASTSVPGAKSGELKFQALVLDEPVCDEDGRPVRQMQLVAEADAGVSLAGLVDRKVTVVGVPMTQRSPEHFTPLVLAVKNARVR